MSKRRNQRSQISPVPTDQPSKSGVGSGSPGQESARGRNCDSVKPQPRHKSRGLLRRILVGLAIASVLTFLKVEFEKTETAEVLEQAVETRLQLLLAEKDEANNVVIVDITDLDLAPSPYAGRVQTPRDELLAVVKSVAYTNPAAIGVDLEFEPDKNGDFSDEDKGFLRECLSLTAHNGRHIPVFVGIYKAAVAGLDRALEQPEFAPLWAEIVIPTSERNKATHRMTTWIRLGEDRDCSSQSRPCIRSLSKSLVDCYKQIHGQPDVDPHYRLGLTLSLWFSPFISQFRHLANEHLGAETFEINFGSLLRLKNTAIPASSLEQRKADLCDKIVLLGRVTSEEPQDHFNVPGVGGAVPGIFVHSAATNTLLQEPLFVVTYKGDFLAECVLTLIALGLLTAVEWWLDKRAKCIDRGQEPAWLRRIILFALILLVGVFGVFVDATGILWTGFLVVAITLALHDFVETYLEDFTRTLATRREDTR